MSHISTASSFSRKLKAAEEAEAAKVQLRYHDLEKQRRAEFEEKKEALQRLEILKKLDIAEAKLKAIEKVEIQDIDSCKTRDQISLPDISLDNNTKVNTYLNSTTSNPPILTPQTVISTEDRKNGYTSTPDPHEWNYRHHISEQPLNNDIPRASYSRPAAPQITTNCDTSKNSVTIDTSDLCKLIVEQANLNRLPPPEPAVFSGTALEYPAWKASFQTLIENKNILPEQRMYYLQKYLSGPAKACVQNFFLFNTEGAYNDAKALLEERYGNQFTIACSLRQKLKDTSKIGNRDSKALRNYADLLRQCESAMSSINSLNILNDSLEIEELLEKLPDWLFNRWSRISYDSQKHKECYPSFCEFVKFVTKEADILCDPVAMIRNSKRDSKSHSEPSYKHKNYSGNKPFKGNNSISFQTETTADKSDVLCLYCNKAHHISDCNELKQKSLEDRKSYFFKNNLCFGCLNIGHRSQNCQKRLICKECSKPHPSLLHGDFKQRSNTDPKHITSHTSYSKTQTVKSKSSMIVPVYLSHDDDPQNELLVYALEDTQSDSTFILSKSANELNLKGVNVNLSLSTMTASNLNIESSRYTGLSVRGINSKVRMSLPPVYSRDIMPANRSHIPVPSMVDKWPHLQNIRDKLHPLLDCDVALLIGYDCPKLLAPINVIPPVNNSPFAQETVLGWGIIGILDCENVSQDAIGVSHRIMTSSVEVENNFYVSCPTKVKEIIDPKHVLKMFELDFNEHSVSRESFSSDDKLFLDKMSKGIHSSFDNHYEMPLPFKGPDPVFPNNKSYSVNRMKQLEFRLRKDYSLYKDYVTFMSDIIDHGYAELVPKSELSDLYSTNSWYIPLHSVYHAKKPGKIRVVFDCNARYSGSSLNDCLLKGPDLTNTLLGVLCRFRKEPIAFTCDIEKMFYQFKVNECHRNYLRFLWWENNNLDSKLLDYRMTVHLFGAGSSPGCANFGLKQAANDYEEQFGATVSNFIRDNFYVDDGLKSVKTELEAIELIRSSKELLSKCGINLHKFISNSPEVLNSIPVNDRAQGVRNLDLSVELPIERVLGVHWHVDLDKFNFHITLKDKPLTRRGILSTISSIYDPLGFIAPFILIGKQILQELCRENIDWDGMLPDRLRPEWERWRNEIIKLESVELDRCLKPKDFGDIRSIELHHFSDASSTGYGQCSYIRLVNYDNLVHCALLIGKSRVIPLRAITIPRLELSAAVVSVKISQFLEKELHYENVKHVFWTDSTVVMGYIRNDVRRFQVFVANRIQTIRDFSDPDQWNYVKSKQNPADIASRGAFVDELVNQSNWFSGPDFLWSSNPIHSDNTVYELNVNDPEIKKSVSFAVQQDMPMFELDRFDRFSSWYKLKRAIANCIRFKCILRNKVLTRKNPNIVKDNVIKSVSVSDLCLAETEIIKRVQYEVFKTEIDFLTKNKNSVIPPKRFLKKSSSLFRLDPFLNSQGLLCVGGRLKSNDLGPLEKHPVILPRKHHITSLIIRHFHILSEHQGRGITTNILRSNGYWIIKCTSAVYEYISKCINCRKYRGKLQEQKMANIPEERLQPSTPFTVCGVDCFGPFIVKEGRRELKRYGLLFTCMCSRAVHIETLHSMSTDSFINGLRRFIAIRGSIRSLYCDNGSNFVGANSELFDKLRNLDQDSICDYLLRNNCDYFQFKFNVPHASHMGGIWERQIRSVRNVLISLLSQCGTQLDDETLNTFMFEAAAIVNRRPLSVDNLNDPKSLNPLTPNHLLTMKSNIVLPPPGDFVKEDIYSRKRWRRVQYLCNVFWSRWKSEYLQNLQLRQKWNKPIRNIQIGDIVLLCDENVARNQWILCRVVETFVGNDNLVRKVKLLIGNRNLNRKGQALDKTTYLERPIHKLVLVVESEN